MTIDKQKLQKLLWAEAASYRADCADWKRNTEALDDFLGEKTVGEVALELLAENECLREEPNMRAIRSLRGDCEDLMVERDQFKADVDSLTREADRQYTTIEAYRKDGERYRWLREARSGYIEVVEWIGPHATGMTGEDLDALLDAAMGKGEQS